MRHSATKARLAVWRMVTLVEKLNGASATSALQRAD
jgi:hypothetical protein